MGFYHPGARLVDVPSADLRPVITPHEYRAVLCRAMHTVLSTSVHASDSCPQPPGHVTAPVPPAFVEGLRRRVRRCPDDTAAQRLLGVALLHAGQSRAGLSHLNSALAGLLRAAASGGSLNQTLCAQIEIVLLLVVLAPISARLGRHDFVRRVMTTVLLR